MSEGSSEDISGDISEDIPEDVSEGSLENILKILAISEKWMDVYFSFTFLTKNRKFQMSYSEIDFVLVGSK